jgi:hypothetical protein
MPVCLCDLDLVSQVDVGSLNTAAIQAKRDAVLAKSQIFARPASLIQILEVCNLTNIDFLSIDVEGHELEVIARLDLKKFQPTLILVETGKLVQVCQLLSLHYRFVSALSHHDYLFEHVSGGSESSGEVVAG